MLDAKVEESYWKIEVFFQKVKPKVSLYFGEDRRNNFEVQVSTKYSNIDPNPHMCCSYKLVVFQLIKIPLPLLKCIFVFAKMLSRLGGTSIISK